MNIEVGKLLGTNARDNLRGLPPCSSAPWQWLKKLPGTSQQVSPAHYHTDRATAAPRWASMGFGSVTLAPWISYFGLFGCCRGRLSNLPHDCSWVCWGWCMYMWYIQHVISVAVPPWHPCRCSWRLFPLLGEDDDPGLVHWQTAAWFTWTVTDCTSNLFQLRISSLLSEMHEMSVRERRDQLGRAPGLPGK